MKHRQNQRLGIHFNKRKTLSKEDAMLLASERLRKQRVKKLMTADGNSGKL